MKKRWKVFWVMCIVLVILGIALCISGRLLGATLETVRNTFGFQVIDTYIWNVSSTDLHNTGDSSESYDESAGEYGGYGWRERFSDIRKLEIDVTCLEVELMEGDGSEIFVDTSNISQDLLGDLEVSGKGEELEIELKNRNVWEKLANNAFDESKGTLLIRIPAGMQFEKAKIQVGAGILRADELRAEELDIEVGAGQVYLDSFTAQELSLECGAGEADLYGEALREAKIECGIGTVNYTAAGSQEDYNYEVECGIGSVTVGEDTYSGLGKVRKIFNGGSKKMAIECGIGLVDVSFDG